MYCPDKLLDCVDPEEVYAHLLRVEEMGKIRQALRENEGTNCKEEKFTLIANKERVMNYNTKQFIDI